jgi:hypothetical protein
MENNMFRFNRLFLLSMFCLTAISCRIAFAAVGCELNDPDRDIKKAFPQSTGYKTDFITIVEKGGEKLKTKIEEKLGDKLDPLYESLDVPYTYYTALKGKDVLGHVHGVNQKGLYGGMQLIIATDPKGMIILFYYQKLSSSEAKELRDISFTGQFTGLTLEDFYKSNEAGSRISNIKDPTKNSHEDFRSTLRGLKKNMILLNEFILKDKKNEDKK